MLEHKNSSLKITDGLTGLVWPWLGPGSALARPSISLSKYLGGGKAPRAPVHSGLGGPVLLC